MQSLQLMPAHMSRGKYKIAVIIVSACSGKFLTIIIAGQVNASLFLQALRTLVHRACKAWMLCV